MDEQTKRQLEAAQAALRQIARREGCSVEAVRKHIQIAIISGMTNPDPAVRRAWAKIPRKGEYPTPEEVIAYEASRLKQ